MSDYWFRQLKDKLIEGTEMGKIGDVYIKQFAGGKDKGLSVQLTSDKGGYVQMTKDEAKQVAERLLKWSSSDKPALPGEFESVREAVGDYAEPIYDLIDELGDSSIVLDNLIRYLDGDQIKDFVDDFRRMHDMPKDMDEASIEEEKRDTHCSDKCCGSDVKAEDCNCPPDCDGCNCNATEGVDEDMDKEIEESEDSSEYIFLNAEEGGIRVGGPARKLYGWAGNPKDLAELFTKLGVNNNTRIMHSSDVDFASEEGFEDNGDAHEMIDTALQMMQMESKEEKTMEQLDRILSLAGVQVAKKAKAPVEEDNTQVAESDIDQIADVGKVYPKIKKMKMELIDSGMEPEDAHDKACENYDVDPDMCDKYIEMMRDSRESVKEDDIEEGSIKYMHSLKAKGKSIEEIAKELDMSVEEVKQAMSKTDESVETTEEAPVEEAKAEETDEEAKEEVKEETLEESPTMDTTQLIHLLKLSGVSQEKIDEHIKKLDEEWGNTPEGVGETEPTVHGDEDNYNFAQMVNLSLKRYLDAQDMKVTVNEDHTVEGMKAKYDAMKNK